MSFLEVLWEIITMWQLWLCLVIVALASLIMTVVVGYIATFSLVLALIVGAVGILLTLTMVVWLVEK